MNKEKIVSFLNEAGRWLFLLCALFVGGMAAVQSPENFELFSRFGSSGSLFFLVCSIVVGLVAWGMDPYEKRE